MRWGADQQVGAAVAVDVAGARDGGAEGVRGALAGERMQERAVTAGVQVRVAGRVERLARRAADDVVVPSRFVSPASAIAKPLASPGWPTKERSTAPVAPERSQVVPRSVPGSPMIASAAPSRLTSASGGDGPAEVVARGPRVLPEDVHRFLEPALAAAGATSVNAAATAMACLSMQPVLRAARHRRFHEIAQLRRCDPKAARKRSEKCEGVQ